MLKELITLIFLASSVVPLVGVNTHDLQFTLNKDAYVTVTIVEQPKNLELLQMYVENHTVLNLTQVERLFIPNDEIQRVVNYFHQFDLSTQTYLNVITVSGSVGALERALHGTFYVYKLGNITFYDFEGEGPSPIGSAYLISTNFTKALLSRPNTLYNVTQAVAFSEVKPEQLREAYNVTYLINRGINGNGTSVGILDFYGDPYIVQQLNDFDKTFNVTAPPFLKVVPIGPYDPNNGISNGWALEISLDVEYVHLEAPNAGIYLYVANPDVSLVEAIAFIDQQDEVNVLSQSFGIPEIYFDLGVLPLSCVQALDYEYWLGEVEGITFVAASGDGGGTGNNFFLFPNGNLVFPASDPYVLAAGGTSLYVSGNLTEQTAWSGESVFGASTGGFSSIFPSPWYQGSRGFREVPDVVADANPYTGVPVIYYYNQTYLVGGTSLASPTIAGILDLMSQVYGRLGFVNTLIYQLSGTKALVPVTFGYNTPYVANSSYNPVSGLGYINAGYMLSYLGKAISMPTVRVAVQNTSYLDGQIVKVVAKAPLGTRLTAYVYNGTSIIEQFPLLYNGSYWVGTFTAEGDGVEEVVVKGGNYTSGTYIVVGLQATFLLPQVAIYYQPGEIPILVQLLYPNGSVSKPPSKALAEIYNYSVVYDNFSQVADVYLTRAEVINISAYGISISSNYLDGAYNISGNIGGIYMVKVNGAFGFDEFVEGIYVVPALIPSVFTEPTVASPGSNVTLVVITETVGSPNVTVYFYKDDRVVYSTEVNSIYVAGTQYYVKQITVPSNMSPGYYKVVAVADYYHENYTDSGVGFTQIYVSPGSLSVKVSNPKVVLQGTSLSIYASIDYPNGTPVALGSFTAVVIPSFMADNFDSLSISYAYPMVYVNGTWVANVSVVNGSTPNGFGLSEGALSSPWYIYVFGSSSSGYPTETPSSLNYNTLNIAPEFPSSSFILLPLAYVSLFNGSYAYGDYINYAYIVDHNATIVDSIVRNATIINATVTLINSQIYNYTLRNGAIVSNWSLPEFRDSLHNVNATPTQNATPATISEPVTNQVEETVEELVGELAVVGVATAIAVNAIRKAKRPT